MPTPERSSREDTRIAALGYRLAIAILGDSDVAHEVVEAATDTAREPSDWVAIVADVRARAVSCAAGTVSHAAGVSARGPDAPPPDERSLLRDSATIGDDAIDISRAYAGLTQGQRHVLHDALLGRLSHDHVDTLAFALDAFDAAFASVAFPSEDDIP